VSAAERRGTSFGRVPASHPSCSSLSYLGSGEFSLFMRNGSSAKQKQKQKQKQRRRKQINQSECGAAKGGRCEEDGGGEEDIGGDMVT